MKKINVKQRAKRFIAYYRVSTPKQGKSGLGMEAQKTLCENYVNDINGEIISTYSEIKSGKENNRTELSKALDECKATGATLLVAKLDRLSREVEFIFNLRNSGVNFICSDMPDFNTLTLGIFAAIAQYERELTSERTINALKEKKKQGFKLGNPYLKTANNNSLKVRKENAFNDENNRKAGALIISLRQSKITWKEIAQKLNQNGFKTRRGCDFTQTQAQRLYERYIN
jgi:DNA invertase Pin-like site-specific DNA recombinase